MVDALREEWLHVEPGVLAQLPIRLCANCLLPTACQAGVASLLRALNRSVAAGNSSATCSQLGLCPGEVRENATVDLAGNAAFDVLLAESY